MVQNTVVTDRSYVASNLAATAGLVALARRSGVSWTELGLGPDRLGDGFRLGMYAGGLAAAGLGAALGLRGTRPLLLDTRAQGHSRREAAIRAAVRFPLGTALFEEVAFRGVLEALWNRRIGPRAAAVVSATAFGAWHLLPTYRWFPEMGVGSDRPSRGERLAAAVGSAVLTGVSGVGFTWLRRASGSVAAPWLAHLSYNSLAYLAARRAWVLASR